MAIEIKKTFVSSPDNACVSELMRKQVWLIGSPCCLSQVEAQLLVVQKLEEKEGILQSSLTNLEKELGVRIQALELNKRKVAKQYYLQF